VYVNVGPSEKYLCKDTPLRGKYLCGHAVYLSGKSVFVQIFLSGKVSVPRRFFIVFVSAVIGPRLEPYVLLRMGYILIYCGL
jgi:hypothetical protein